jgi:hypothetical protein
MKVENQKSKLVFVYNADSGVFNLAADISHKMFSPQTYACNLCALTHSNFGMKKDWKKYLESLDARLEFLHVDEFKKKYALEDIELPAIFKAENDADLALLVDAQTINECRTIEDLKRHIEF